MRPVNLIPRDQRRARRTIGAPAARTGIAVYAVLGALAFGVVAVAVLVTTSNKINDRTESIAALEREAASAKAAADALRPYGNFAQMQEARVTTIKSLVASSFNWERVLRAFSRSIPSDVWLVSFIGTVRPGVSVAGSAGASGSGLREKSTAPAIELVGCTYSHSAVARMMTRMRNLDGVTEVALSKSERSDSESSQGGGAEEASGGGGKAGGECRTQYRITKFEIVVVFGETRVSEPAAPSAQGSAAPIASAQAAAATGDARSSAAGGVTP